MMKIPDGYDKSVAITGESQALPSGGYICRIRQAREEISRSGKQMLVIYFDIAEGEFADYFKKRFISAQERNVEAKWPGVFRQLTEGSSTKFFKGLIESIEKSNPGYKWEFDETTLKGKLFGGVFGRVEYYAQATGEYKFSTECRFIRNVDAIRKGVEIPDDKRMERKIVDSNETVLDDDLPF